MDISAVNRFSCFNGKPCGTSLMGCDHLGTVPSRNFSIASILGSNAAKNTRQNTC